MKRIISGLIMLLLILFSANCVVANNWNSAGDSGRNDRDQGVEECSFIQMTLPAVPVSSSTYAGNMALNSHYIILESVQYPIIQINVKIGDENGKEDVRQYEYIARVYNSSQKQVGEDIVLKLNGNPDNSLSTVAHGTASLPSDLPEGNYYVFLYQNNTTGEFILPFMCTNNGKLETCCNESSMTGLISEGILVENCSKFWCCGCGCTKQQVKNRIYIKNGETGGTGEEPGEEDKPPYVNDMVIPARHNVSESTQCLINVTLGDDNGRNDTKKYTYVAKVFNSSQKQVGENIDLTLTNPFDDEDADPTSYIEAQGMASLPADTPEGNYYLFVYRNNTINESILPFLYNSSENLTSCCNEISCLTSLISGEDIISDSCSESWCCGCNCTGNDVKNRIYIENEGAEDDGTGDDGTGDDGTGDDGVDDEGGKESIDDGENNVNDGDKPSKRRSSADRGTLPIRKKETTESFSLPPETRIAASNPGLSINALADDGHQKEEIKDSNGFDWLILLFLAAMFGLFLALCGSIFSRYSKLQKER